MSSSPATLPVAILLARIPAHERHAAIGDILEDLQDRDPDDEIALSTAKLLSELSHDSPDVSHP